MASPRPRFAWARACAHAHPPRRWRAHQRYLTCTRVHARKRIRACHAHWHVPKRRCIQNARARAARKWGEFWERLAFAYARVPARVHARAHARTHAQVYQNYDAIDMISFWAAGLDPSQPIAPELVGKDMCMWNYQSLPPPAGADLRYTYIKLAPHAGALCMRMQVPHWTVQLMAGAVVAF